MHLDVADFIKHSSFIGVDLVACAQGAGTSVVASVLAICGLCLRVCSRDRPPRAGQAIGLMEALSVAERGIFSPVVPVVAVRVLKGSNHVLWRLKGKLLSPKRETFESPAPQGRGTPGATPINASEHVAFCLKIKHKLWSHLDPLQALHRFEWHLLGLMLPE